MRPDISTSPVFICLMPPSNEARPARHLVDDAERIHDVEGKQARICGFFQHVAAGVEHEIRRLGWYRGRC